MLGLGDGGANSGCGPQNSARFALDGAGSSQDTANAVAKAAAGFDIPGHEAHLRPSPMLAHFLCPHRAGAYHLSFMVGGAREPQGSPVLVPVCQPRIVRHSV